jgi:hypothetical protein
MYFLGALYKREGVSQEQAVACNIISVRVELLNRWMHKKKVKAVLKPPQAAAQRSKPRHPTAKT